MMPEWMGISAMCAFATGFACLAFGRFLLISRYGSSLEGTAMLLLWVVLLGVCVADVAARWRAIP